MVSNLFHINKVSVKKCQDFTCKLIVPVVVSQFVVRFFHSLFIYQIQEINQEESKTSRTKGSLCYLVCTAFLVGCLVALTHGIHAAASF